MQSATGPFFSSSQISHDYLHAFEKVADFFSADFKDIEAYKTLAEKTDRVKRPFRRELQHILLQQGQLFGCNDLTKKNIKKLSDPDTLAVVTGQQTGLFGGPLYTLYKALTTIKLADDLSRRLNRPVVPVFYLVSEDHDFAEVQWAGIVNKSNTFQKVIFAPEHLPHRLPVAEIILDDGIEGLLSDVHSATADTEFKEEVLARLAECYRSGTSFSLAFARWFSLLLAQFGVILLDASDARLKPLVKDVFARELDEQITEKAIAETNIHLESAGYHTQLVVQNNRPAVFILKNGRQSLERTDKGYKNLDSQEILSVQELAAQPALLSPKAALRPIVQDTLLPTIAYVGGPGEIAYWAQLKGVYRAFELPMPAVVPRASFTLIEPKIKRHLEKFGLSAQEVIAGKEDGAQTVLRSLVPEETRQKIQQSRENIIREIKSLGETIVPVDPTLASLVDKTKSSIEKQLQSLEQRMLKSVQDREQIVLTQWQAVVENLLPEGKLQERQVSVLPFLIKYHWAFIDTIYQHIDLSVLEHRMVEL
jgi:bacillithiol biosynthesis cysteine-adding enzyme BshC